MPPPVLAGGQTMCSFGNAPGTIGAVPKYKVMVENKFPLTIADTIPMLNVMPMGMCIAPTNPTGMGKPPPAQAPAPCIPIPVGTWVPPIAPTKLVGGQPILLVGSTLMCQWLGVIQVSNPGSTKEQVS